MKLVAIIVPILVVVVIALGFAGVVKIPGITPDKAQKNSAKTYAEKDDKVAAKPPAASPKPKKTPAKKLPSPLVEVVKKDPDQGAAALATVWNELSTSELAKIAGDWKDEDLAKVLMAMDTDKVAKFLAQ